MPKYVLIVARSGRQLAEAARACGYEPLVVDFFGDIETETVCRANIALNPRSDLKFDVPKLADALRSIWSRYGAMPLVWGSGLESQPHLLAALAPRWDIKGCSVATLFRVNDPRAFGHALAANAIRAPKIASGAVPTSGQWLLKQRGSCGGLGVRGIGMRRVSGQREYFQRAVAGTQLSAAFVAAKGSVSFLGICEALNLQYHPRLPYRFSGAIAAPHWLASLRTPLTEIVEKLSSEFALRGLCGVDVIVDRGARVHLIELNPRPPATFDLLASPGHVFEAHMQADTPAYGPLPEHAQVRAMAVCYAEHPITVTNSLNWPDYVSDRPQTGSRILPGMPVCSISAAGATVTDTRRLLEDRLKELRNQLRNESTIL